MNSNETVFRYADEIEIKLPSIVISQDNAVPLIHKQLTYSDID